MADAPMIPKTDSILIACGVGCFFGLLAGWMLAYVVMLPAMMGLVGFIIAGVLLGMLLTQIIHPMAKLPPWKFWLAGVGTATVVWLTTLALEWEDLPVEMTLAIEETLENELEDGSFQQVKSNTRDYVYKYMAENYPPGGMIGYVRWAVADGEITYPRAIDDQTQTYVLAQHGVAFLLRLLISLPLLAGGIMSQLLRLFHDPLGLRDYPVDGAPRFRGPGPTHLS